jgi:hypothetical protein
MLLLATFQQWVTTPEASLPTIVLSHHEDDVGALTKPELDFISRVALPYRWKG